MTSDHRQAWHQNCRQGPVRRHRRGSRCCTSDKRAAVSPLATC